ncbi:MAG: pullulanase-type alpha-1,6-glucosidase, partial [Wenzhouxiangella sp.]
GGYEVKVAHNEDWAVNFGLNGEPNGPNIPFTVPPPEGVSERRPVWFFYDPETHILSISVDGTPDAEPPEPERVVIAGSFQTELGCAYDWKPDCDETDLVFDEEDRVWQRVFELPAGNWEYKAPLNGDWDINFGANATRDGPNIPLSLSEPTAVKFYYSNRTNWVTDDRNSIIATAAGSFQHLIGCNSDWDPACLRSWLQDPDGDGIFTFSTRLPAGDYEVKVAHNEDWEVNFGLGGVPDGPNIPFSVPEGGDEFGAEVFFSYDPSTHILSVGLEDIAGDLRRSRAHWVAADTIAWNPAALPPGGEVRLHHDPDANLALAPGGISGGGHVVLAEDAAGLAPEILEKFPHLSGLRAFTLPDASKETLRPLLKGQLAVSATDAEGTVVDATGIQIPGVLDDLFFYDGALGPIYSDSGAVSLAVWAPTARSVRLLLFDGPSPTASPVEVLDLAEDPDTGVWRIEGPAAWDRVYYLFEVEVYAPTTRNIETNRVTDPYSLSLAANSTRSQFVNLDDAELKPEGWEFLGKPPLEAPEDIVLYELHVRDFSIADETIPAADRGRFTAFTQLGSVGMAHLGTLAEAGVTHLHLLPAFDFATVPERDEDQVEPAGNLADYPPDSPLQQAAIWEIRDQDGFNWGYDPLHFTTPQGSYATDPDGATRILEFRRMVQALNQIGIRVVMDVVYNHTNASGQNPKSVLDRIVPGYYHRLNADGFVEMSSCCPNTASEHLMMEKLMVDSALTWVLDYKIDGFRFDLMGHHMKSNILKLRERIDALTLEEDGVDGPGVYIYGEGWNFGEVANNARGVNAIQRNMTGTGVGTFNDRLRDGVRGGSAFGNVREQGFINGLYYDPNELPQGDALGELLHRADWIRIGLAGTLADFEFVNMNGDWVRAEQVDYFGQMAGYTADPQESINMSAAHDNETLFDAVQLKAAPTATLEERIRMQWLGTGIVALGQGIPFFHAGQEMLRSKSMDRDSFNSGDWFNQLDYSFETNNWGRGLPVADKNQDNWPVMAPLLANPDLKPGPMDLAATVLQFEEMVRIRKSSGLFRLRTAEEVKSRLTFHNTGPEQIPGLIVMSLDDAEGAIDRRNARIVTLINALKEPVRFPFVTREGRPFELHPVQRQSADPLVRTSGFDPGAAEFFVPARTIAVFVSPRPAGQRIELLIGDVQALVDQGILNQGQANSLTSILTNALRQLRNRNNPSAANMLQAFVNEADAMGLDESLLSEA